jgi:hypothetical protein
LVLFVNTSCIALLVEPGVTVAGVIVMVPQPFSAKPPLLVAQSTSVTAGDVERFAKLPPAISVAVVNVVALSSLDGGVTLDIETTKV